MALLLSGCSVKNQITRSSQYAKLYEEKPLTLLVMPPINNTSNVEAKEALYTSINVPLAEAGYYVIPPRLVMDILKTESAYDAELFYEASLTPFKNVFGADAVIFSFIETWTKQGFGIKTKIRYVMKSAHTEEVLFDRSCDLYLNLQQNVGGASPFAALINLAASAITTALADHIIAARKANNFIFQDIPRGKYNPQFGLDKDVKAQPKDVNVTVK